jgi:hypothetical protein
MVIIVLFVTLFFLYREYKYDNTRNKQEVSVFQYFSGVKVEYTSIVTYNLREAIVSVEPKNKKIEGNRVPIYYKDMSKIIFPVEMTIAFPLRNGSQYRLYQYATYSNEDGVHFIKNNTDLGNYSNFFLYDGKSVFFFPEETVLKINGKERVKLGALSYVNLVGGVTLIYYDTAEDKSEVIELNGEIITVEGENLHVNVTERYFKSFSSKVLLSTPNNLNSVFKTIDN